MRSSFALVPILLALAAPVLCSGQNPRPDPGEHEASANFDAEDLDPVLLRLSSLTSGGFTVQEAHKLVSRITAQAVRSEATYTLHVTRRGKPEVVRVVAWKDDPQAYDVFFFTTAELANALSREISSYMSSVGK